MVRRQHVALGEIEEEQRILGNIPPVDELIDDKIVGLERQDPTDHLDVELDCFRHFGHLRDIAEIGPGVGLVLAAFMHGLAPYRGRLQTRKQFKQNCFTKTLFTGHAHNSYEIWPYRLW